MSSAARLLVTPAGPGLYSPPSADATEWNIPLVDIDSRNVEIHLLLWIESFGTASSAFATVLLESGTTRIQILVNSGGLISRFGSSVSGDLSGGKPGLYSICIRGDEGAFQTWVNGALAYTSTFTASWAANNDARFSTVNVSGTEAVAYVLQYAHWHDSRDSYVRRLSADPSSLWEREQIWVPASAGGGGPPTLSSPTTTNITTTTATLGLTLTF